MIISHFSRSVRIYNCDLSQPVKIFDCDLSRSIKLFCDLLRSVKIFDPLSSMSIVLIVDILGKSRIFYDKLRKANRMTVWTDISAYQCSHTINISPDRIIFVLPALVGTRFIPDISSFPLYSSYMHILYWSGGSMSKLQNCERRVPLSGKQEENELGVGTSKHHS